MTDNLEPLDPRTAKETYLDDRRHELSSATIQEEIRDLFRDMVMEVYREFSDSSGVIEERDEMNAITDLDGVGENKADTFREAGYESLDDLFEANPEDLQEIDGVGEVLAKKVTDEGNP